MTVAIVDQTNPVQGTPLWWRNVLERRLMLRLQGVKRCDDYYSGKHHLAFAGKKFREAFGGLFKQFADNWCGIVVDAVGERLNVEGFRFGPELQSDSAAWTIWQRNALDADSEMLHTDMLATGFGYSLVWADANGKALITIESPFEAIVAHQAGNRRVRAAGFKKWIDDDGYAYGILYMPDALYKYKSRTKKSSNDLTANLITSVEQPLTDWEPFQPPTDDVWPLPNPLGVVPLIPYHNSARTTKPDHGISELATVIPIQDAVNKLCTDLLVASEFGSFRQRWAAGLELDTDRVTGEKLKPFDQVPGALWATEQDKDKVAFGEFAETNLQNIVTAVEMFVQHLASQTRTPPHYLNASISRFSGESIKAAETGLVAKVSRKSRHVGENHEETLRLAFLVEGDEQRAGVLDAETIWADFESRTEAEHTDATLKKASLGIPNQQLWEDLGYTPQQIARFQAMRAQDLLMGLLAPTPSVAPSTPQPAAAEEPLPIPGAPAPGGGGGGAS